MDFDPFKIPEQLVAWLCKQPEAERDRASAEFAKRAVAAKHVLTAVAELRKAVGLVDNPAIPPAIRDLLELARDLHDYDPTSD